MAGIKKGTVIYASTDEQASFDEAVAMIRARGYTKAQVRMIRRDGSLLVEAITDLT